MTFDDLKPGDLICGHLIVTINKIQASGTLSLVEIEVLCSSKKLIKIRRWSVVNVPPQQTNDGFLLVELKKKYQ